jgi:type IV pilus assembly protein PilC
MRTSLPFTSVRRKYRIAFYTQLGMLMDAGISPIQSLRKISSNLPSKKLSKAAKTMADHIEGGGSLKSAFALFPEVFPAVEQKLIEASELSGSVTNTIANIAELQEDLRGMIRQFWIRLTYPAFILFTAFVIVPLIRAIFSGNLENWFEILVTQVVTLGIMIFFIVWIFKILSNLNSTRWILHEMALRLPIIKGIIRHTAQARFSAIFEGLYSAGTSVIDAYTFASQTCGNETISRKLLKSGNVLKTGGTLTQAVAESRQFPEMAVSMIEIGEQSGKLDEMLKKYSKHEEQEAKIKMDFVSKNIPVLIYFGVLIYIAYIIISGYLNIFQSMYNLT